MAEEVDVKQGGSRPVHRRRISRQLPEASASAQPGGFQKWDHIRKNNLQNPQNKRKSWLTDKLKKIFGGKDRVSMFE